MATAVSKDVLNNARTLVDQGDVSGAWLILSEAGDNYATQAAKITGPFDPSSYTQQLVRAVWESEKGTLPFLIPELNVIL